MPLVEIKEVNALIGNKPFFDHPVKSKQKAYEKTYQNAKKMTIQMEIY